MGNYILLTCDLPKKHFLSIVGGFTAGIMGFTSFTGFIFYFLIMAITSVGLLATAGFTVRSYFDSWNRVVHFYLMAFWAGLQYGSLLLVLVHNFNF